MTYAFITEWMSKEDAEKFDRDLSADPRALQRAAAAADLDGARQLMSVFGMATG